jgi:hypothetical protein
VLCHRRVQRREGESFAVKLLMVGDVMLGRLVNQIPTHALPYYPWGDTLAVFAAAKMQRLCVELITEAVWLGKERYLSIEVEGRRSSGAPRYVDCLWE